MGFAEMEVPVRFLQIGGGNMGGALLERWVDQLSWSFTVVDPGQPALPEGVEHVPTLNRLAGTAFDALIVAVKPQILDEAVAGLVHHLKPNAPIISIAAGVPCERFEKLIGAHPVIRAMPNMPVKVGQGMSGLVGNSLVTDKIRTQIETLFAPTGHFIWLDDEDAIDRFTAIAGSGPGYVFELLRSYAAAAANLGFSEEQGERMAAQTIKGAIALAMSSDASPEALRNAVTSKNGTTEAGLDVMRREPGFESLLLEGTKAAYDRAVELRA